MTDREPNTVISLPRFSDSLRDILRGLSVPERLSRRRRLHHFIDQTADRLIAARGAAGARGECIRRMAFCARAASGARWTIWRRIHKAVKLKTGYDESRRRRVKDDIGVC